MREHRHGKREAAGSAASGTGVVRRVRQWSAGLSRRQRICCRVLIAATAVLVVALGLLRWWVRLPQVPDDLGELPGDISGDLSGMPTHSGRREGAYTFLVVGRDTAGGGNTDTMLLLTYDTKEKTLHGLNLPRDTMVNVSTRSKRLNAVYNYNKGKDKATQVEKGMDALKTEVAKLTGIRPDFYVMVEWEAIGKLVDALGGVEYEVPFDMDYDDPYQDLHIHQKAGLRLLSGDDAMQVIRHRKNNDGSHSSGDVGRLKVQQGFLKAAVKTCLQPSTFLKLPSLVEIFVENVTTDLSVGNILAFAELARGMDGENDVTFATAPLGASFTYKGASMVTLDLEELLEVVNRDMNPYVDEITAEDLELLVRQKDGSFRVTNGTLADENMGKGTSGGSTSSTKQEPVETTEPEPEEEPDDPAEQPGEEDGEGAASGEEPGGESADQPGETGGEPSQEGGNSSGGASGGQEEASSNGGDETLGSGEDLPLAGEKQEDEPSQDMAA